jgi:hypothetical protein
MAKHECETDSEKEENTDSPNGQFYNRLSFAATSRFENETTFVC